MFFRAEFHSEYIRRLYRSSIVFLPVPKSQPNSMRFVVIQFYANYNIVIMSIYFVLFIYNIYLQY